jgi:hypothetical protein
MEKEFKGTMERDGCEKNSGEKEGPCACSYIGWDQGERRDPMVGGRGSAR